MPRMSCAGAYLAINLHPENVLFSSPFTPGSISTMFDILRA
jgi:hypothetical protein